MTVKKYIADSLGTVQGFLYPQLSEEQIDLKIQYSTDFLNVIGLVDPGITEVIVVNTLIEITNSYIALNVFKDLLIIF